MNQAARRAVCGEVPTRTRRATSLLLVLLAAGCAPARSASTGGAEPARPMTLDEAEAELARAERDLGLAPPPPLAEQRKPADAKAPADAPPPPPPATANAPPLAPAPRETTGKDAATDREEGKPASPCAVACRALSSMKRAADTICRIAGDDSPRCGAARQKVVEGTARVAACGCG